MLFNTTYTNEDYTQTSIEQVGKAFGFFERIKMGGIGSSRLQIKEISANLQPTQAAHNGINYANIELRPKGIIIHYTHRLDRYSWVIPYYKLVMYSTQNLSFHADGHFITCRKNQNYQYNKKFIKKIMFLKIKHLQLGYYDA